MRPVLVDAVYWDGHHHAELLNLATPGLHLQGSWADMGFRPLCEISTPNGDIVTVPAGSWVVRYVDDYNRVEVYNPDAFFAKFGPHEPATYEITER